jgi:uncharacterized protein YabE (DUF348 family)
MEPTRSEPQPSASGAFAASTQPHPPVRPQRRSYRPFIAAAAVLALIVLLAVGLLVASLLRTTPVTVVLDGEAYQRETRAATVAELLDDLGISLEAHDYVSLPPDRLIEAGTIIQINRARSLSLTVDGRTTVLWSALTNPAEILNSAGVPVGELDRILLDGSAVTADELERWPVPVSRLNVRHAVPLHVDDNGERRTLQTTAETIGDALFDAGIPLFLADSVSADLNTAVTANLSIQIVRAHPVVISADGASIETRTQGDTVADALADAGIALMGLDYTIPSENEPLRETDAIRVVRVKEQVLTQTEPIPFETVYQADDTLEIDQRSVLQEGQQGIRQTITRVRYEDGQEVSRTTSEASTLRAPVNRVIVYGASVTLRTIDTPDGPRSYWRVLHVYATSYHPAALGGDAVTATGRTLQQGIVAADTSLLPFGTEVFIPGYGVGLVADTAPPRRDDLWIDLGYSDADYQHWSRYVDIYVLTPVPENINYLSP